jgi:hypothetical protein
MVCDIKVIIDNDIVRKFIKRCEEWLWKNNVWK